MNEKEIYSIVVECLQSYLETQGIEHVVDDNTVLLGSKAIIDSMGLVNVIIDIESAFLDEDVEISLASEEAMSRRNSPFRTVSTLSNFINEQINKDAQNE